MTKWVSRISFIISVEFFSLLFFPPYKHQSSLSENSHSGASDNTAVVDYIWLFDDEQSILIRNLRITHEAVETFVEVSII